MGTITKALKLLNHFSSDRGEIGLASFVRLSGGDKATVRRHLIELVQNGFLEQHPETKSYRLGPAILRLATVRETHFPVRNAVRPVIDQLAEHLGELVHASLLQGDVMSPVYHRDPQKHGLRVIYDAGEVLPLHATASGLAMLAFGPQEVVDTVLSQDLRSYSPTTVVTRSDLMHLIACTRDRGYSFSDQYLTKEIVSFGLPFYGIEGTAIGTLAVPLPQSRLSPDLHREILGSLFQASKEISRSCGGEVPRHLLEKWTRIEQSASLQSHEDN